MKRALVSSLLLLPVAAGADDVFLRGRGRLSGVIVGRGPASVTVDVGPGRVTVPMSRVTRIVAGTADLTVYRDRAARLSPSNVTGWLALARWAEEHDLLTQAREAYAHVLTLDPQNAAAHRGLGDVWMGDRWATLEESYRARGYVLFEGSWVTPEERHAIVAERAEVAAAARDLREAEARARPRPGLRPRRPWPVRPNTNRSRPGASRSGIRTGACTAAPCSGMSTTRWGLTWSRRRPRRPR